jgi:hypothetical protein
MRDGPDKMPEKRDTAMIEDKDRDSVSLDKEALTTVHHIKPGMTAEDVDFLNNIPAREQARIYHKVDRRLVPMLALLYLIGIIFNWLEFVGYILLTLVLAIWIAHLDRANIGNAKIEGLEASLGMVGTDYNVVVGR